MPAVEVTTKYATVVDSLPDAWAFVMDRIEKVGPDPRISISPMWVYSDDEKGVRKFEVCVNGTIKEGQTP